MDDEDQGNDRENNGVDHGLQQFNDRDDELMEDENQADQNVSCLMSLYNNKRNNNSHDLFIT